MPAACSDSPVTACRSLAELFALDPTVRAQVGPVHATIDGAETVSPTPALWIWSSQDRFTPRRFHESTLDASIAAAHEFLSGRLVATTSTVTASHRALRTKDEQEGGIIIPDYMY
jgi:hypothetical protein